LQMVLGALMVGQDGSESIVHQDIGADSISRLRGNDSVCYIQGLSRRHSSLTWVFAFCLLPASLICYVKSNGNAITVRKCNFEQ